MRMARSCLRKRWVLVPRALKMPASSTAMYPAPTTATRPGCSERAKNPSLQHRSMQSTSVSTAALSESSAKPLRLRYMAICMVDSFYFILLRYKTAVSHRNDHLLGSRGTESLAVPLYVFQLPESFQNALQNAKKWPSYAHSTRFRQRKSLQLRLLLDLLCIL